MLIININFIKLTEDAKAPFKATQEAACFDVFVNEDALINPGKTVLVGTGIAMAIPQGYHAKLFVRSSTGVKTPLRLANLVGIIDSDYRGEIKMPLWNPSDVPFRVFKGDRLCQILIEQNIDVAFKEVKKLSQTKRGVGGFGSTNRKEKQ